MVAILENIHLLITIFRISLIDVLFSNKFYRFENQILTLIC